MNLEYSSRLWSVGMVDGVKFNCLQTMGMREDGRKGKYIHTRTVTYIQTHTHFRTRKRIFWNGSMRFDYSILWNPFSVTITQFGKRYRHWVDALGQFEMVCVSINLSIWEIEWEFITHRKYVKWLELLRRRCSQVTLETFQHSTNAHENNWQKWMRTVTKYSLTLQQQRNNRRFVSCIIPFCWCACVPYAVCS